MHSTLPEWLVRYDRMVWYYLNVQWHNPVLDFIIPFLRNQWFWTPLYLFLAIYMPLRFRKYGWFWCAAFIITFGISDQLSAHLIKPIFARLRPCNDQELKQIVHLLVDCGSGKSFPSSHAANHFALAVFSSVSLAHLARWVWPVGLLWAASVAYAQVYVGVHFPLDVVCGGILGALVGWLTGRMFNRRFKLQ